VRLDHLLSKERLPRPRVGVVARVASDRLRVVVGLLMAETLASSSPVPGGLSEYCLFLLWGWVWKGRVGGVVGCGILLGPERTSAAGVPWWGWWGCCLGRAMLAHHIRSGSWLPFCGGLGVGGCVVVGGVCGVRVV
jgi:hypothetical protein